ncbi:hypothetical protein [Clostridium tertium]|uniref:hypothetical protein n=1 Tax=Clostridium tertium TaxID=1559 RepID=UPI003565E8F6
MICKICGQHSNSWVNCPRDKLICDKCCIRCNHIDYSTSYITCTYKRKEERT